MPTKKWRYCEVVVEQKSSEESEVEVNNFLMTEGTARIHRSNKKYFMALAELGYEGYELVTSFRRIVPDERKSVTVLLFKHQAY